MKTRKIFQELLLPIKEQINTQIKNFNLILDKEEREHLSKITLSYLSLLYKQVKKRNKDNTDDAFRNSLNNQEIIPSVINFVLCSLQTIK